MSLKCATYKRFLRLIKKSKGIDVVQQIISSSKTNIETLYQRISYFPEYQLISSLWFPHTRLMTEEDLLMEIELLLHRVIETKSNKVLFNCKKFDFFVSPSGVNRYLTYHNFELSSIQVHKVALLPPQNNMIKISLEQALGNMQHIGNYVYRTFDSLSKAIQWLKSKA